VGEEEEAGDRDPEGRGGQAGTRGRGRRREEEGGGRRGRREEEEEEGGLVQMDVSLIQEMEDCGSGGGAAGRGHSAWLSTSHCSLFIYTSTIMHCDGTTSTSRHSEGDTSTITVHEGTVYDVTYCHHVQ